MPRLENENYGANSENQKKKDPFDERLGFTASISQVIEAFFGRIGIRRNGKDDNNNSDENK